MDNLQNLFHLDTKYNIIGQNVLQLILLPGEKVISEQQYIQYYSRNLTFTQQRRSIFSQKFQATTIIENKSKEVAYIGIHGKEGKIMVMDAAIFMNFHVKEQSILAHNDQIDLENSFPLLGSFKKIQLNQKQIHKFQVLFLHTDGIIIDKDLGSNESIVVKLDQIVALSDEMRWSYNSTKSQHKMIECKGPGRIFLEIHDKKQPKVNPFHQLNLIITTLFSVVFLCIFILLEQNNFYQI